MFKNKEGLFRSGWKITLVFAIIFGLVYLEDSLFNHLASLHVNALGVTQDDISKAYKAFYSQWDWLQFLIREFVMIAVPVIAWKMLSKRKLADMGFGRLKVNKKPLGIGLLLGVGSMTIAFFVILLTGNGYMVSWTPRFTANTVLYLFVFIIVGFAEELLTRGYVMSVLRQTKCMPLVIATSSVLFSLMHIRNNSFSLIPFINIVLAGLLFAYMFIKSGSIWMPIGYHITWNYFQGCVYGFPVSGHGSQGIFNMQYASDTILNGGAFGPEGGLVVTIVLIVSFMFIKWYFRNSTFQFMDMDTPAALQALYRKVEHDNNKEHFGIKKNDSACAKRFIY